MVRAVTLTWLFSGQPPITRAEGEVSVGSGFVEVQRGDYAEPELTG